VLELIIRYLNHNETEVMQMKIKTKVNHVNSAGCRCFRPGDPEFEVLASLVTPLHKIRSECSGTQTLYQEEKARYSWKRNESFNDLYIGNKYLGA
jgi:hypothetical protein